MLEPTGEAGAAEEGAVSETQTIADLDRLLAIWAEVWAGKHRATLVKFAYRTDEIRALLTPQSGLLPVVECLSAKILDQQAIEENDRLVDELSEPRVLQAEGTAWQLVVNNASDAVNPAKATLKRSFTTQIQQSWTASAKVGLSLEFGTGVPPLFVTKLKAGHDIARSETQQKMETKSEEQVFDQTVNGQPWKKTFAAIMVQELNRKSRVEARVNLTGGVVICCDKAVHHTGVSYQRSNKKHKKWYITIQDIFRDLQSYKASPLLNPENEAYLKEVLDGFSLAGEGVSFTLTGEITTHRLINPEVSIREESIPDCEAGANQIEGASVEDLTQPKFLTHQPLTQFEANPRYPGNSTKITQSVGAGIVAQEAVKQDLLPADNIPPTPAGLAFAAEDRRDAWRMMARGGVGLEQKIGKNAQLNGGAYQRLFGISFAEPPASKASSAPDVASTARQSSSQEEEVDKLEEEEGGAARLGKK